MNTKLSDVIKEWISNDKQLRDHIWVNADQHSALLHAHCMIARLVLIGRIVDDNCAVIIKTGNGSYSGIQNDIIKLSGSDPDFFSRLYDLCVMKHDFAVDHYNQCKIKLDNHLPADTI